MITVTVPLTLPGEPPDAIRLTLTLEANPGDVTRLALDLDLPGSLGAVLGVPAIAPAGHPSVTIRVADDAGVQTWTE